MKKSLSFGLFLPALALVVWAEPGVSSSPKAENAVADPSTAAVFPRIAEVLRHPRCMNCHTTTHFPKFLRISLLLESVVSAPLRRVNLLRDRLAEQPEGGRRDHEIQHRRADEPAEDHHDEGLEQGEFGAR